MADPDLVERLSKHRTLADVPPEEVTWLAEHGSLRYAKLGETITREPDFQEKMIIVLSGHIAISIDRGLGPRKTMEWGPGDVSGYLPYSRMTRPPGGDGVVDEPGDMFLISRTHFPTMIRECPVVTEKLVHMMLDRARRFTSSDLQDEKMQSLGRLSAGLAHELNNPASAAARSARLLSEGLTNLEEASRAVGAAQLRDEQREVVERWRQACVTPLLSLRSPLERADREEAIGAWLEEHDADPALSAALVDTPQTIQDFEGLAAMFDGATLSATLRWLAADCASRALAADVEKAARRVHDLVAAIKRHTYMDRTSAPEPVDLGTSLSDSLVLLQHKARKKSVSVSVNLEPNLPRVLAIGGDLNQVWTNLIDNALDAVPESGTLTIGAERRLGFVLVRVVDNGTGIPQDIRERIFEPFFTTKPVGQGTGQGLDITRRLVRRNNGDIEVESRPGRTEFRVTLPAAQE